MKKMAEYTLDELIAERDALAPKLRQEQHVGWYEIRHQYNVFANEIARRLYAGLHRTSTPDR